jgi:hypothetical protein
MFFPWKGDTGLSLSFAFEKENTGGGKVTASEWGLP